jgi:hypothetical protein
MTNFSKTIVYIGVCSITIILTNLANTISIKKAIEQKEAIEKRAYKKLTKENKELIEYIVFGENQE